MSMNDSNLEIEPAWKYLRSQRSKQIPLLAVYGKKYKQYLTDECSLISIHNYRNQLKLFSPEIIDIIELLAEMDVINQLKHQKRDYCHLSQKIKHMYAEQFWYVHSFRPMRSLSNFIYSLNQLIQNQPISNLNRKSASLLGFHLALEIYNKYFNDNNKLH